MSFELSHVEQSDLQMLNWGAFAPLTTFVGEKDYHSILQKTRLANGEIWPIPIVLAVDEKTKDEALKEGSLILRDEDENIMAVMKVKEAYRPDVEKEALAIYGSTDENNPYISKILNRKDKWYVSGNLDFRKPLSLPKEAIPPKEVHKILAKHKKSNVIGFQTRNPITRCHYALTKRALESISDSILLLTPKIGPANFCHINVATRIKTYEAVLPYYSKDEVQLVLIPMAIRMAGSKAALLDAIVQKNYGSTYFIIGRDHAGPFEKKRNGGSISPHYTAQEYVSQFANELGIKLIKSEELVYDADTGACVPFSDAPKEMKPISGTQMRRYLQEGKKIPPYYSFPEVIEILEKDYQNRGVCLYIVGMSASGKSTLALALIQPLEKLISKKVVFLDSSLLRKSLFPELGFTKQEVSENTRRTGDLAAILVDAGAFCIITNMAPFEEDRKYNRQLISKYGKYYEIFVDTSLEVCIKRDPKGLYAQYFNHEIQNMSGLDAPFEKPVDLELHLDGTKPIDTLVKEVVEGLEKVGVFSAADEEGG